MKKAILIVVLPLIAGICIGIHTSAANNDTTNETGVEIGSFKVFDRRLADEFNILLPLTKRPQNLSAAINVQNPDNFYLLTVSDSAVIRKVENGIDFELASAPLPENLPEKFDLVIKRRTYSIEIVMDGTIVCEAYDGAFRRGSASISSAEGVNTQEMRVQRVGEIYFADDFMRGVETGTEWEAVQGWWEVNMLDNSGLSSNAAFYKGKATDRPAISTAGYWFWDNYSFDAAVKSDGTEDVGLCFFFRDAANYFLFRWNVDKPDAPGRRQLVKVKNGVEQILQEAPGGYTPQQYYTMSARVNRHTIHTYIDGHLVFTAYDRDLGYGKIGIYTAGSTITSFDDIFVRKDRSLFDSFAFGSTKAWQPLGGRWRAVPMEDGTPDGHHALMAEVQAAGKAVTGEDVWHSYTFSATVSQWNAGEVGLAARYRDEANHYLYSVSTAGKHTLAKFQNGRRQVLAEAEQSVDIKAANTLFFTTDGNYLSAGINGYKVFEQMDESIDSGRAALYAAQTGTVLFHDVSIDMSRPSEPVLTTNEIFEAEMTMAIWASRLADWINEHETVDNRVYATSWHRADFPCEVEMTVRFEKLPSGDADVRLAICGEENKLASGYQLAIREAGGLRLELLRKGEPAAVTTVPAQAPARVSLKRKGSHVIALVNYRPVISFKDDSPINGMNVGIAQRGIQVSKDNVEVFCPNVYVYSFDKSPSDWRVSSGTWEVTSRWSCDPRWSFFSGQSKQHAIIWCKRLLKGDVTLEFAAAIKMDRERGGSYEYAADINATIAADGQDLTSGYSFMYGGWNNTSTSILRGNEVVARDPRMRIPAGGGLHRRWFYFKIRKQGDTLQFFIDNKLALDYKDPEPLTADRIAIWTHNNGIMVAKVRISCLDGAELEDPAFKPIGLPRSPYTPVPEPVKETPEEPGEQVEPDTNAEAEPDAKAKAEGDAKAEAVAKAEADAKAEAEADAKAEADARAQADAEKARQEAAAQ